MVIAHLIPSNPTVFSRSLGGRCATDFVRSVRAWSQWPSSASCVPRRAVADASCAGALWGGSAAKASQARESAAIHARDMLRLCIVVLNFNGGAYGQSQGRPKKNGGPRPFEPRPSHLR